MEITVYIGEHCLFLETSPIDKRKQVIKQYENTEEGLRNLRFELNRTLTQEIKKIHVFHNEVHLA